MEKTRLTKTRLTDQRRARDFKLEGEELLRAFASALNADGIGFWLEFGTLLGYHREHDFIAHDCDLDFGAMLDDAKAVRKALTRRGFKMVREYTDTAGGREECYRYKHTTLDVFYFRRTADGLRCTSYTRGPRRWIDSLLNRRLHIVKEVSIPDNGFVSVDYKGCRVGVPADCVEHLRRHYGPGFMTPDPNFDYKKEATNITWFSLDERRGIGRRFGKK